MATPLPPNRASFTIEEAEAATRGTIVRRGPELQRGSSGVVSDSRAVALANVFVALRGESHDGHAFLDAACGQDPQLRQQVESLLRAHDESGGILPKKADRELAPNGLFGLARKE